LKSRAFDFACYSRKNFTTFNLSKSIAEVLIEGGWAASTQCQSSASKSRPMRASTQQLSPDAVPGFLRKALHVLNAIDKKADVPNSMSGIALGYISSAVHRLDGLSVTLTECNVTRPPRYRLAHEDRSGRINRDIV